MRRKEVGNKACTRFLPNPSVARIVILWFAQSAYGQEEEVSVFSSRDGRGIPVKRGGRKTSDFLGRDATEKRGKQGCGANATLQKREGYAGKP